MNNVGVDGHRVLPLSNESVGIVGAVVSTIKVFIANILLIFQTLSLTVILQLLCEPVVTVLKVIVLVPSIALVDQLQLPLYAIVHDSVELKI